MTHYTKQTTIRRITFDPDHELHGLEMRTRGADIRFMARVARVFADLGAMGKAGQSGASADAIEEAAEKVDEAYALFADRLVSWNMRDEDDQDVPPTVAGMHSLDDDEYVLALIKEWLQVLVGVPTDLGKDSGSGETFPTLSLPMDVLSPSLAS